MIHVLLVSKNDSVHSILSRKTTKEKTLISEWKLNYPVYQIQFADVDGDGSEDIIAGVIKTTRFDPVKRKRLFIFKLFEGHVRPMWLGSGVGQPLENFRTIMTRERNIIRTMEHEKNGNFLVAEYKYKGFGLQFLRYIARDIPGTNALNIFNKN